METKKQGVGSVARALQLLQLLAAQNSGGVRFTDLCEMAGLSQGTAHRLLRTLIEANFVEQNYVSRRYHLGSAFLELGTVAGNQENLQETAEPRLRELALVTGDTVFMVIRSGLDSLCIARVDGSNTVKALTMSVGARRPLGYGAGALTLLSFSPDAERKDLIRRLSYRVNRYSELHPDRLQPAIEEVRRQGFAYIEGTILKAMATISVPLLDSNDTIVAAISVAATIRRMSEPRRSAIRTLAQQTAKQILEESRQLSR
ncbi:MAG: IclR family transcriptional regulator [Burkholderiaceae bacterium]